MTAPSLAQRRLRQFRHRLGQPLHLLRGVSRPARQAAVELAHLFAYGAAAVAHPPGQARAGSSSVRQDIATNATVIYSLTRFG